MTSVLLLRKDLLALSRELLYESSYNGVLLVDCHWWQLHLNSKSQFVDTGTRLTFESLRRYLSRRGPYTSIYLGRHYCLYCQSPIAPYSVFIEAGLLPLAIAAILDVSSRNL